MITKTDFLMYLDAPKHLWAHKHGKLDEKVTDTYTQHLLEQGYEVESLAQKYIDQVIKPEAKEVIIQQKMVDDQFEARADALVFNGETWDMYEIKSSTSVNNKHEMDATFQYCVFKTGYDIKNVYILHLNSEYERNGEIDISELFTTTDITDVVHSREDVVMKIREIALEIETMDDANEVDGCVRPKTCICMDVCHKDMPEYPIYGIRRMYAKKIKELEKMGIYDIRMVPDTYELTDIQRLQVQVAKDNKEHINEEMVKYELSKATYPLYFLDYESFNPAIPAYDGYRPYEQITFQFSLHVQESEDSPLDHHEFIFTKKEDPIPFLVEKLQSIINESGSIVVWNASFEGSVNSIMARIHPEYADFLNDINSRIYDLMVIFQDQHYDHPDTKGSYSIKKILPVFDKEFSYKELDIQEGATAMNTWNDMVNTDKYTQEEKDKLTKSLLEYCKLDTLAMVKIYEGIKAKLL